VVGEHYPARIVDHEVVSKENMQKMKLAYAAASQGSDELQEDNVGEASQKKAKKARKS